MLDSSWNGYEATAFFLVAARADKWLMEVRPWYRDQQWALRTHRSRVIAQYSAANLKQEIGEVLGCEPARVVITYVLIPIGELTTMSAEEDETAHGPLIRRNLEQFPDKVLNDQLDFVAEGLLDAASRV